MERTTAQCLPLCASIGHHFVTVTVWRCDHHGALSAHVSAYHETAEGPVVKEASEWFSGPFTADLDVLSLIESIRTQLLLLAGADSST